MTKRKADALISAEKGGETKPPGNELKVVIPEGKTFEETIAPQEVAPDLRHAVLSRAATGDMFTGDRPGISDVAAVYRSTGEAVAGGDLSALSQTLVAQALTTDALFTQLAVRAERNIGQYPEAAERYLRLAFKAQAQSRATIETLARMYQPREQTVRHIHVGPQGQAVFVENLHGGFPNARIAEQPYAPSETGGVGERPALPCPDALGRDVQIPGDAERAVSTSRRRVTGRTDRQSQRLEARGAVG